MTHKLRKELKAPLGLLLKGSFEDTIRKLKEIISEENPKKLIAIGDIASSNIVKANINFDVLIVDNKVMRKQIKPLEFDVHTIYDIVNPPGSLKHEAFKIVEEAISKGQQSKIQVQGEEDLLTIPAIIAAPEGSIVVYGQPKEGLVVVRVNKEVKKKIRRIIGQMKQKASKD